jgi:hypothetical protein
MLQHRETATIMAERTYCVNDFTESYVDFFTPQGTTRVGRRATFRIRLVCSLVGMFASGAFSMPQPLRWFRILDR